MTRLPPSADHVRNTPVAISAGNELIDLDFDADAEGLRVTRFGPAGSASTPTARSAIELVTVDSGHAPSTSRLVGGVASVGLQYDGHRRSQVDGWSVTEIDVAGHDGLAVRVRVETHPAVAGFRCIATITNRGTSARQLRSMSTLALRVALDGRSAADELDLWSASSDWLGESRWTRVPVRDVLVDLRSGAHGGSGSRGCYGVASAGAWSTGSALPTGLITQRSNPDGAGIAWAIEHNGGWRWEVGEESSGLYLALSGPTESDHQWFQRLEPGESFTSVPVLMATGSGLEGSVEALTELRRRRRRPHPDDARRAVVFNDYMNTLMGDPTTERLLPLIDRAAEVGAEIFCIDAGWYDDSGDWWPSVGEWIPSATRFPEGLGSVTQRIRDRDMIPGLWLEPEVIGVRSPIARRLPDSAFLTRHGERIVEHDRFHLDLSDAAARAHLDGVIDRLVVDLGIGYVKLDYNINPLAGSDQRDVAAGAGLLRHGRALLDWLDAVAERHPALIIENCASGAMRMDDAMLSRLRLQSTSDQQDLIAYPPIAVSAPMSMPPEQAANWSYPQPGMTDEQIAFTMCTGMLGRMYLSGHIDTMSEAQRLLVSEGVSRHKRIRDQIASSHTVWPLGLPGWTDDWLALAVERDAEILVTVWRRGGRRSVRIPLPRLRGRDVIVETLFPVRLPSWDVAWDPSSAILSLTATSTDASARTLRIAADARVEVVDLDVHDDVGPVIGNATGMLYGVAAPGVPFSAVVSGVRPGSVAQKAPGGRQHPDGDALLVAEECLTSGARDVLVYLQDLLEQWPYEDVGIDHYLDLVRPAVAAVAARRADASRFVFVPFNEGDMIWYDRWDDEGRARFLRHWARAVEAIREVSPGARIAGPNEARFLPERVGPFLSFALENGVLPDVMTWHELHPSSLERFAEHLRRYRALEQERGIPAIPVIIDEYANLRDTSVPGRMLRWIALLEGHGVGGDIAYWTMAGNLDDHAVGQRRVNGGWLVLHWYAALRGERIRTSAPASRDSAGVIAAVDGACVVVLVGGSDASTTLNVHGLADRSYSVRVERARWSGYQGATDGADIVSHGIDRPADGALRVLVPGGDPLCAYRVVILAAATSEPLDIEDQMIVITSTEGSTGGVGWRWNDVDVQQHAGSGARSIEAMPPGSWFETDVELPESGEWEIALGYGTEGSAAATTLAIDGEPPQRVDLDATLTRGYSGRATRMQTIAAGRHRIRIAPPDDGERIGDISLDRLEFVRRGPARIYPAATARRRSGEGIADGAVLLEPTDTLTFHVIAARRGRFLLRLDATGPAVVEVDGSPIDPTVPVVLAAGVSEVRVAAGMPINVERLHVERVGEAAGLIARPDGAGPIVELEVSTPMTGLLTVDFSNDERWNGHPYNIDVVVGTLRVIVGEDHEVTLHLPSTVTASRHEEASTPLTIPAGAGTVRLIPIGSHLRLHGAVIEPLQNPPGS